MALETDVDSRGAENKGNLGGLFRAIVFLKGGM